MIDAGTHKKILESVDRKIIKQSKIKNILIGEDSEQGAALGVARLAMLATKEYKQSEVIKSL